MSDRALQSLLDELEQLLQAPDALEGDVIAAWQARFDAAVAGAERGAEWPQLVARAHALGTRLDAAAERLSQQREGIRREMQLQGQGARALKGYKPA
ncbi:hypothetical protein [Geothrix sp. 21YS21S-4]|uniref:hypothetical protein n=1 Tax=Geothrix sp. 21YS21S-4 TaxID=3068889 RepID=UPI0027B9B24B|nr:hypothetical protein [Geothrix sp. 21YS21S-4]